MSIIEKYTNKDITVGIIGLGYVGLPLSKAFCDKDIKVIGFDIDKSKIESLSNGNSYIKHIPDDVIKRINNDGLFNSTSDFSKISDVDAIIICVPTPLTKTNEPDLEPVLSTGKTISQYLKKGQLVVLESSTYPGTTNEELSPILESSGLKNGEDFYLAYSPEREDPGSEDYTTTTIPKIGGADDKNAINLATLLYKNVIDKVIVVESIRVAEATKLTENIFRSVNIALVNELKIIYDAMGIDVWEVIEGASTKPFGYMPFFPGPGLGGHCIPIDPFYLSFKAKEYGVPTKFIELAGEINTKMPEYVISKLKESLSTYSKIDIKDSKILVIGAAYKKNVDDMRESPSLVLMRSLLNLNADVDYYDPFVPIIPPSREYIELTGMKGIKSLSKSINTYDAVIISTDHDCIDYDLIGEYANLILDTRNAMKFHQSKAKIIKA